MIELTTFSLIKVAGENAPSFLQGQLTCDVTQVFDDNSIIGAICNHQGRILAIFNLFKFEHEFHFLIPKELTREFIKHLKKYAVFSKVSLMDVTNDFYRYGYLGDPLPNHLKKQGTFPYKMMGATARYLVISRNTLEVTKDEKCWRYTNILSGWPTIYIETVGKLTPHMINLPILGGVSFKKGCYVGQEIIARTQYLGKSKRHLCLAEMSGEILVQPGMVLYSNDQEAGLVVDSVSIEDVTYLQAVLHDPIDRDFFLDRRFKLNNISRYI